MGFDLDRELNSEQAAAARNIHGPSLIIAGAGSGKTRMMTYRIAHMLDEGITEDQILALTFTNKAAKEMSERIRSLTGKPLKKLTTTTFHSFGLGLLKQYIQHLGYRNNFTIYDTNDNMSLIRQVIAGLDLQADDYNIYSLLSLFSDLKTGRVKEIQNKDSAVGRIYDEWLLSQKAYNVVDFDDLIILPIRIFEKRPDVLEKVQDRFRYIMVDEFQDTSLLQYRMVSERNYRSTGNILEAANNLIVHNSERKSKKLWTSGEKGSSIFVISPEDEDEEAFMIAEGIRKRHNESGVPYGEFGILVRTNSLLATLENALMENGIMCAVSGGTSFFDRKEVRDILCYLKLIVNSDDDASLLRIINTPRRGIGRVSVEKLRKNAEERRISLFDALTEFAYAADSPVKGRSQENLKTFSRLVLDWQKVLEDGRLASLVSNVIEAIGYREMLYEEYPDKPKLIDFKMKSLEFLVSRISRFEKNNPDSSLRDYLNLMSLDGKENSDREDEKVNLMTMHASKGLEFDTVYLAGVEDNIIPSSRALEEDAKNIDEERRLFYVAITRARRMLTISHCGYRKDRMGERHMALPSRFLEEIPSSLFSEDEEMYASSDEDRIDMLNALIGKFRS